MRGGEWVNGYSGHGTKMRPELETAEFGEQGIIPHFIR